MKSFIRYINFLTKAKLIFELPKRSEVLLYDSYKRFTDDMFYYLDKKNCTEFFIRGQEINIPIFLRSLLSLKFFDFKRNYILKYIQYVSPKIVITFTDNDMVYYTLKENFKNKIIFIVMQNGLRGNYDNFESFKNYKKNSKYSLVADYFLSISEPISKKYKKYIKAKYIPIGLFRNNLVKKQKTIHKKRIIFLSSYSNSIYEGKFYLNSKKKYADGNLFFKADKIIINFLIEYSKKFNFDFKICLRSGSNFEEQKNLIYKIFDYNKNLKFLCPKGKYKNYQELDRSVYIACVDSAFGYEAYARNCKVGFFTIKGNFLKIKELNFGWPLKLSKGKFWTNENRKENFYKVMNYLTYNKNQNKKFRDQVMFYDPGNSVFVKILKNLNIKLNKKLKNKKKLQVG